MSGRLWQDIDAADCTLSGITAYRVNDVKQRTFRRTEPRPECALTFVTEGSYLYESADGSFTCGPGDMTFLPRGSLYRHEPGVLPSRMYVVYFTLRRANGSLYDFDGCPVRRMTCAAPGHFERLFSELCTKYFGMMTPHAEVKAALHRILGALAREESSVNLTEAELARLSPALEYLAANSGDIRVAELAKQCCLSEYAFRELFKKYAGMPPKAYILNRRVGQVEALCAGSDITLTDAARTCGFEDPAYFFKVYRRLRGHAPGKMQK